VTFTALGGPGLAVARKMSRWPFVSPGTRFVAKLWNPTKRPSGEISAEKLIWFAWTPAESTLTRSLVPATRSRTNTSSTPFVSPRRRFEASLWNAT
jgi:hypothetical protein